MSLMLITEYPLIYDCASLTERVNELGFLPLLSIGYWNWSADDMVEPECRYTVLPEGGWEWPLWKWKGEVIRESGCAYGKFIRQKACFVSREWWPDFCNFRRGNCPRPAEGSIEDMILQTLCEEGSMITRDLRAACGFDGRGMRSKFDTYITRLQMAGRVVTEDFVYPVDRHGKEYGWGWALLTTPEQLFGREACHPARSPEESFARIMRHLLSIFPDSDDKVLRTILK